MRHYQQSGLAEEERSKQKGRSMRKTFNHRILYGQMDDGGQSCQNMSEADGKRGVNGKKVREVRQRVSRHTVVANTCKFVLDTRVNG